MHLLSLFVGCDGALICSVFVAVLFISTRCRGPTVLAVFRLLCLRMGCGRPSSSSSGPRFVVPLLPRHVTLPSCLPVFLCLFFFLLFFISSRPRRPVYSVSYLPRGAQCPVAVEAWREGCYTLKWWWWSPLVFLFSFCHLSFIVQLYLFFFSSRSPEMRVYNLANCFSFDGRLRFKGTLK